MPRWADKPTTMHVHTAAPARRVGILGIFIPLTWILTLPRHDPLHRFHSRSHFRPTEEPHWPRFPQRNVRWWINHTIKKKKKQNKKNHASFNSVNRANVMTKAAGERASVQRRTGTPSVMNEVSGRPGSRRRRRHQWIGCDSSRGWRSGSPLNCNTSPAVAFQWRRLVCLSVGRCSAYSCQWKITDSRI